MVAMGAVSRASSDASTRDLTADAGPALLRNSSSSQARWKMTRLGLPIVTIAFVTCLVEPVVAHDYGIYTKFVTPAPGNGALMNSIDLANDALNAGLEVNVASSLVNNVEVGQFDTEEMNQLLGAITCGDGDQIAFDASEIKYFGPGGEMLSYAEAIYHVVKLISYVVHELAHITWIAHFNAICNDLPPLQCEFMKWQLACHAEKATEMNLPEVPCTEAYAYETESEKMCAIACAKPPGLARNTAKTAADGANTKCETNAALCGVMSADPPNGCGPLPEPDDQGGCRGPCECED